MSGPIEIETQLEMAESEIRRLRAERDRLKRMVEGNAAIQVRDQERILDLEAALLKADAVAKRLWMRCPDERGIDEYLAARERTKGV